ncbi:hypothetical protein C0992_009251 [Termitomyces sp. T32_za158]|nr:hypothetical protein C0992_009251 [Termitomyces sp. T32_za158]
MAVPKQQAQTHGQIFDLVALIKNATSIIESYYLDSSLPTVPSLDCLVPHPLDSKFYEPACLRVVVTFKIPDILQEQPSGMDIKELGRKAGVNHEKLGRIMRLLATKHIFREGNKFLTSISIATPEGAKKGKLLGIGMRGLNTATQAASVVTDFPWGKFPPGTTVNDVGGGFGNIAMELIKAYPNLQLKLQDLPRCIHQAETQIWPKFLPSAIAEKRIEFKAMDFFVEPPIPGCDIYYLKSITHNWPDKECIRILRNIRAVLKPGARVLLHDYVIQHANHTDSSPLREAPKPMLPNYGAGRIRPYNLDLAMLVLFNSKQRTLEEFIDIAGKAGLEFVKLWPTGEMGVVELRSA